MARGQQRAGLNLRHPGWPMPESERPELRDLAAFREYLADFGDSDYEYLRVHFERFVVTSDLFLENRRQAGGRVLDVGAHWLHQSVLWSLSGFRVTALDVPAMCRVENVRHLAAAHDIELLPEPDLESATGLSEVPDDRFDVVLFCEILEHLAFNPVAMWREIHRVLAPGGRIVVTTPNYYRLRSLARKALRFARMRGGGVPHREILSLRTHGHHWKEYSAWELKDYFRMLSDDFRVVRLLRLPESGPAPSRWSGLACLLERGLPVCRPTLYAEISMERKAAGIQVEPRW